MKLAEFKVALKWLGQRHAWKRYIRDIAIENIPYFYEVGLEMDNPNAKKSAGQFFTPADVSRLMAEMLVPLPGENICDVCCGTGNLILSYLELLGRDKAIEKINSGNIWVYDTDELAVWVLLDTVKRIYGTNAGINVVVGDFLDGSIVLPENSKVISNPPYFKIKEVSPTWENTPNIQKSKELYSAVMERILKQSTSSVIISPYSFLSGKKFQELRNVMSDMSGEMYVFDNVPTGVFKQRVGGGANSVRAVITKTYPSENKGYRVSGMIRFRADDREGLLSTEDALRPFLGKRRQRGPVFERCFPEYEGLLNTLTNEKQTLQDYLCEDGEYILEVPTACRYFTSASSTPLIRSGKVRLCFSDYDKYLFCYILLNSSLAYLWWRVFDGGITYPVGLLKSLPVFMSDKWGKEVQKTAKYMMSQEPLYRTEAVNKQQIQESIKFPLEIRERANVLLLQMLHAGTVDFTLLHSNSVRQL